MKPMPKNLQSKSLTDFHFTVLAVQALRPDRLYSAMSQFASRTLGKYTILKTYLT